jgi:hypothetical protein
MLLWLGGLLLFGEKINNEMVMKFEKRFFLLVIVAQTILFWSCNNMDYEGKSSGESNHNPIYQSDIIEVKLPSNQDIKTLGLAYGFLKGQQHSLNKLRNEMPLFENEILKAELEFELAFGNAKIRIEEDFIQLVGEKIEEYNTKIHRQQEALYSNLHFTTRNANDALQLIKDRANGKIESPVLETILMYQFIDNPAKEFISGYVTNYQTEGHSKAKGINLSIKLPMSWKKFEGDRPNIVNKFGSENGKGREKIMILIRDMELSYSEKMNLQNNSTDCLTEDFLESLIPKDGQKIYTTLTTIDGLTFGQVYFYSIGRGLESKGNLQSVLFTTIYDGKLIMLSCGILTDKTEQLSVVFNHYLPLFKHVANSLIIENQYSKSIILN